MSAATKRFIRHYLEMVAAMFLGMLVLGMPAAAAMSAAGTSMAALRADAPALALTGMTVSMTVPMVGWMVFRGHGLAPCMDMTLAMVLPTIGIIALLAGGIAEDFGTLMMLEHVVMLPAMLVAMLLRRDEYTGHHHHAEVAA